MDFEQRQQQKADASNKENGNIGLEKEEEKRKSVSFVDEKLIINAIKSTNIGEKTLNQNANVASKRNNNSSNGSNSKRITNKQHPNQHFSNNYNNTKYKQQQQKGSSNQLKGEQCSSNPVIIYYSNPEAEINVSDLLNKVQQTKQIEKVNNQRASKSSDNHHSKFKDQLNNINRNGFKQLNDPPFNQYRNNHNFAKQKQDSNKEYPNHHQSKRNNQNPIQQKFSNYEKPFGRNNANSKSNYYHMNLNNKNRNQSNMTAINKTEPITIYYNDNSVSLEENLKRLRQTSEPNGTNMMNNEELSQMNNPKKDSSQSTVINEQMIDNKSQQMEEESIKKEKEDNQCLKNENETICQISPNLIASNDVEDVISGGVAIENPQLPKSSKTVICTLVSHPGHLYVKFLNDQHEQQLMAMNNFYKNDEHIELTIDVLKPGQYFAASRSNETEWIRVQLLYVESSDSINCFLIDEGCFSVFKLSQLQPLYNQFRSVPKQAIRVSLSGVRPKENDWLPNEALEFKQLVENRKLKIGNIVNGEHKNEIIEPETIIEIELFFAEDKGNENFLDRSVADVLIERNIALKK